VYSRIGTSNITDNAYGVLNVANDGVTAQTGNPNATEQQTWGNLIKAEGNWWGLRYSSVTNPGPAISPTTNPQVPENPVNGTATVETATGGTTSNSVDFFPYRSGPQSDPTNGELPVLTAPIPVDDAAPTVSLSGPASAAPGATITLTANAADDFGIKRVRFAEGTTTLATDTAPPYTASVTIPANAVCNSTRTYSAIAMDSLGQTTSATTPVTVTCGGGQPTPTPTATATPANSVSRDVTIGGTVTGDFAKAPEVAFVSWPRSIAGKSRVTFTASAAAGLKSAAVILGSRTLCVVSAAPFSCDFTPQGSDVGGQTLRIVATDAFGQTAEVSRTVTVSRFVAKLKLSVAKKSTKAGIKRTLKGSVSFPSAVTANQACQGKVVLTIKRSGRSIINQEVPLTKRCTFERSITTKRSSQFSAKVTFGGNTVLSTTNSSRRFS
jgi:hypothetical protein